MTDSESNKAFRAERSVQLRRLPALQRSSFAAILALLAKAFDQVDAVLRDAPSDYERWVLPALQRSIREAMATLADEATRQLEGDIDAAWAAGIEMVDQPIAAGGVEIAAVLPQVDVRQLAAMRTFLTGKIRDLTAAMVEQVNTEIGLVAIGAKPPSDAVTAIAAMRDGAVGRSRAITIVRTELGRAYETAGQERKLQASKLLPGLRKQWRRSGKLHSRLTHDVIDGQIRKIDEPFDVAREKIMYPRDPKASARNTINCGCTSLPLMKSWEVSHPREMPVGTREMALSPAKRRLDDMRALAIDSWSRQIASGRTRPRGTVRIAGGLDPTTTAFLAEKDAAPVSGDLAVSDRQIAHMLRDTKARRGSGLPLRLVRRLPAILDRPRAILWDKNAKTPTLVYVVEAGGAEKRLATFVVKLRDFDRRQGQQRANFVVTGGLVNATTLADASRYELVRGVI